MSDLSDNYGATDSIPVLGDGSIVTGTDQFGLPTYADATPGPSTPAPPGYVYDDAGNLVTVSSVLQNAQGASAAASAQAAASAATAGAVGGQSAVTPGTPTLDAASSKYFGTDQQLQTMQANLTAGQQNVIDIYGNALDKIAAGSGADAPPPINWQAIILGAVAIVVIGLIVERKI